MVSDISAHCPLVSLLWACGKAERCGGKSGTAKPHGGQGTGGV